MVRCGRCLNPLVSVNRTAVLTCERHLACDKCGMNSRGCLICICDSCDAPLDSNALRHLCGCGYHRRCDPGPNQEMSGCLWCHRPHSEYPWYIPATVSKNIESTSVWMKMQARLSLPKLNRKMRQAEEEKRWTPEDVLGSVYYTDRVWKAARFKWGDLRKLGFKVSHFVARKMNPETFLRTFEFESLKDNEDLIEGYPELDLTGYCEALKVKGYLTEYPPEIGFPKALRENGVSDDQLAVLFRKCPAIILTDYAPMEQWKESFRKAAQVYAMDTSRTLNRRPNLTMPATSTPPTRYSRVPTGP